MAWHHLPEIPANHFVAIWSHQTSFSLKGVAVHPKWMDTYSRYILNFLASLCFPQHHHHPRTCRMPDRWIYMGSIQHYPSKGCTLYHRSYNSGPLSTKSVKSYHILYHPGATRLVEWLKDLLKSQLNHWFKDNTFWYKVIALTNSCQVPALQN